MRAIFATAVTALVSVSLYGCGGDDSTTQAPVTTGAPCMNIPALATSVPELSTLVELLTNQSLVETLDGEGPFTVFAPTNAAFTAAQSVIETLTSEQIHDVLLYHVVPANATAADLMQGESLATVFAPHNLTVHTITPNVTIQSDTDNDATVTQPNNFACNGVVHIVDAVLVPNLGPAPAPAPGSNTTTAAPGPAPPTTSGSPAPAPGPLPSILELAASVPDLSSLVDALTMAQLTDALSGPGPFTVFAPTNAAFTAAAAAITDLSPDDLTNILTYHVHSGEAKAADLTQDMDVDTLFTGHDLTVHTLTPTVTIESESGNDATVTGADNMASNGVVHIVDAVLMPSLSAASLNLVA